MLSYSDNIKGLKKEAEKLDAARTDIQRKVDAARNNNEEIQKTVQLWMRDVDEITAKKEKLFEKESQASAGCSLRSVAKSIQLVRCVDFLNLPTGVMYVITNITINITLMIYPSLKY